MFAEFERHYTKDGNVATLKELQPKYDILGFKEFFEKYSGASFNKGVYHLVEYDKIEEHTQTVVTGFPDYKKRAIVFAFDWLGRVFAMDGARRKDGSPLILSFDFSRNEVLEIPCTFIEFHNLELVEYGDDALSSGMYAKYLNAGFAAPQAQECCGPKVPIFLGGAERFEELDVIDVGVYWHLTAQLLPN